MLVLSLYSYAQVFSANKFSSTDSLYWEFLRERLFGPGNPAVSCFQEDIFLHLYGASHEDSVIIKQLLHELHELIPNKKIEFADKIKTHGASDIVMGFNEQFNMSSNGIIKHSPNINGNQIKYDGFKGIFQEEIYTQYIHINLNDTVSYTERERYIYYAVLRSLCTIKGNPAEAETFIDSAVYNGFDYNPANTVFTDADRFLIQKLYSSDFQEQFKKYMVNNHSKGEYLKIIQEGNMELRGFVLAIICGLVLLIAFYFLLFNRNFKNKYSGYLIPGLFISISIVIIQLVYNTITENYDAFSHFISGAIPVSFGIALSGLLYFIEKFIIKPKKPFNVKLVIKVFLIFVLSIMLFGIVFLVAKTFDNDSPNYTDVFINYFFISLGIAIARGAFLALKELSDSSRRAKDVELSRLEELKAQAEMKLLQARINPHFLYNSLNSIAGLARSNPDKTEKMALSLSDLFRYTINRQGSQMTTLGEEVEMVGTYLEIEQIRFGDRMKFSIHLDKELEQEKIPRFIVQPLVENAIKHGISKIEGKGEVSLTIRKLENGFVIEVADNGPGFVEGLVSGYGLQSLYDMLKLYYGNNAQVNWQNEPAKKMSVTIYSNV